MRLIFYIMCICLLGNVKSKAQWLENEKQLNYLTALEVDGHHGLRFFIVVTVKNLNTGEVKELCTGARFLEYALVLDGHSFEEAHKMTVNSKKRYFELKNEKALDNVGFKEYSTAALKQTEKKYDFKRSVTGYMRPEILK